MGTLIYSPNVEIIIHSDRNNTDIDVSEDIVSGTVTLNENAPHSMNIMLDNPRRKYDGVFMPNDRFIVRLKRRTMIPIMSGFLNSVPFASVWPRAVNLTGTCTLKRLQYRVYDPGTKAMQDLLLGIYADGADKSPDGNLSKAAAEVAVKLGDWKRDAIHIADLPTEWWDRINALYTQLSPVFDASIVNTADGSGSGTVPSNAVVTGGIGNPSIMGVTTLNHNDLVTWYNSTHNVSAAQASVTDIATYYISVGKSEGVRGDLAFADAMLETGWLTSTDCSVRNNFAGIAHPSGASAADIPRWSSPREGVIAHIHLLKRAATGNSAQMIVAQGPGEPDKHWGGSTHTNYLELERQWAEKPTKGPELVSLFSLMFTSAGKKFQEKDGQNSDPFANMDLGNSPNYTSTSGVWVFPVPGAEGFTDTFWAKRGTRGERHHQGVDLMAPEGTAILAAVGGVVKGLEQNVTQSGISQSASSGLGGNYVGITDDNGAYYYYCHMQHGSNALLKIGQRVTAGQQIGAVGHTGDAQLGASHCHFEFHPNGRGAPAIDPTPYLNGAEPAGASVGSGSSPPSQLVSGVRGYIQDVQDESMVLSGIRRLMNDGGSNVLNLVGDMFGTSMRNYCSAPNGDLIAWFPDYFGSYGHIAKAVIEDIELIDFTINWSDAQMVTHQFVTGTFNGTGFEIPSSDLSLRMQTKGIASIDFPEILKAILGDNPANGNWTDPQAIYDRFGARPTSEDVNALVMSDGGSQAGVFFYAVKQFMLNWASMFSASVPISFMPELFPGMIMQIPSRGLQVYISRVSHSFDMVNGFTTTLGVMAPSSLNGTFYGLPSAGVFGHLD